jgi:formate-dependent phosphoribosylglycinamide formyltransferase (GAR transformylase)
MAEQSKSIQRINVEQLVNFNFLISLLLVCAVPNPDQAFACLDMTYISALLHHGFGLATDTKLQVGF